MSKLLDGMQSVSDFMNDAIEAFDGKDFAAALHKAAPWWGKALADTAGEAFPLIGFVLKFAKQLMKENDPEKQGYSACTMAYNRAVEQSVSALSTKLALATSRATKKSLKKGMPKDVDMGDFSYDEKALEHAFVVQADLVFRGFAQTTGLDARTTNKLINGVHRRFLKNLRLLLAHPQTAEKFEAFSKLLSWDLKDYVAGRAIEEHADYQWWLFNEAPVFGREPFALSHVYTDTDCGVLTYRELNAGAHPFSEAESERTDLLEETLKLIADPDKNEPIVIWGIAGAGKSAFTLRLTSELIDAGLRPIRVALGDLDVSANLLETLPNAVRLGDKEFGPSGFERRLDPNWFKKLTESDESTSFGNDKISPYVLIFDGWDEISTGATAGFRDDVNRILGEIRSKFIDPRSGRKRPKIGVVITGRPSVDVTKTSLFEADTPILTIRPFTPNQLSTCIANFTEARRTWPVHIRSKDVTAKTFVRDAEWFDSVVSAYASGFEAMLSAHRDGVVRTEPTGSMGVVGLPLLAHLALRLMIELEDSEHLSELVRSPTTLYRALVDMTYEKGAKFTDAEIQRYRQHRLVGSDLRVLLWHVAAAITASGREHISREELRLQLDWDDKQLHKIVEDATKLAPDKDDGKNTDNVLAGLIIGFFFKEGTEEQGCQFMHKSFREYLFAEGVVELLKNYGRYSRVIDQYSANPGIGFPQREVYWRDFEEEESLPPEAYQDPRYQFTHRLAEFFATKWISPEIKDHIRYLLEWEVNRGTESSVAWPGKPTEGISEEHWQYVRDGLADVWDWWAEGVLLRSKPKLAGKREMTTFTDPFVVDLSRLCSPLDSARWKEELPDVVRLITVDARLGEAFFHLNSVIHSELIRRQIEAGKDVPLDASQSQSRRRYQVALFSGDNSHIMFAPSGEDYRYFANFCARINAPGWRPLGAFPSHVFGRHLFLAGVDLRQQQLVKADFSGSFLKGANLSGTDLSEAIFNNACLDEATLDYAHGGTTGIEFRRTSLSSASLESAHLGPCHFDHTNFTGATIRRSQFIDSAFINCNFDGASCRNNNFSNASGVPPEILDSKPE